MSSFVYSSEEKTVKFDRLLQLNEDIRESWKKDKDKTQSMEEIIALIKDIISKSTLEEYFQKIEKDQTYFVDTFVKEIVYNIIHQSYVYGEKGDDIALELLFYIFKLFEKFHDKQYPSIFRVIRTIFKENNKHPFFYPNDRKNDNPKKKYPFTKFNEEFCSNFKIQKKAEIIYEIGDQVDILSTLNDYKNLLEKNSWIRGIVKKIENDCYYVQCNGEKDEEIIPVGSKTIQPKGKNTIDWDWRLNLKKYDLVDVYSRDAWWPCTIVDVVEKVEKDGIKRVKYKIGYRLYLNHFNNKEDPTDEIVKYFSFWNEQNIDSDENGEEFVGDNTNKDEEIFHFSKRIQKFNTLSQIYKVSKDNGDENTIYSINTELMDDEELNENSDINYSYKNGMEKNIIYGKNGNFSYYYACLLKKIEKDGGFENFLNILRNKANSEEVETIFTIYLNSLDYIHDDYFEENKVLCKDSFINYLNNLDDKEIRKFPEEIIDLAKKLFTKIFKGKNDTNQLSIEEEINLNYSLKKLKTSIFDKRQQGIKEINDFFTQNEKNEEKLFAACELMKNNKIILVIFGSDYHSQILSKSKTIVKHLLKNKLLDEEDIKYMWACTQRGDLEAKKIIIKILDDLKTDMDEQFIGQLMEWVIAIYDKNPAENELGFIHQLSLQIKTSDNKNKICLYFCNSLFKMNIFSNSNPCFQELISLITRDEYYLPKILEICQDSVRNNKHTLICYSMIIALFEKYIIVSNQNEDPPYRCLKPTLNDFLRDEHLLKIFIVNFNDYITTAKEEVKNLKKEEYSKLMIDGFSHDKNIDGRLAFLTKLLNMVYPNFDFIDDLTKLLLDIPVFPEDKQYFYRFFKEYCFPKNKDLKNLKIDTREKAKKQLFKIFASKDQTNMTIEEFSLFIEVFLFINSVYLDYNRIKKIKEEEYEYEIKLKQDVEYKDIIGVKDLWNIILKVKDEKVINGLMNIINQVVQENQIVDFLSEHLNQEEDGKKTQQLYKLLILFLIEMERNKIIDVKPHSSLLKNSIIRFPLEIKNVKKTEEQNEIELFYDNTSLNEIKEILSRKYKIPMEYIITSIIKNKTKVKLDFTYDNKSLREILIEAIGNDKRNINIKDIIIFEKNEEKIDLIIDNQLSPKFKGILKEWFEEFSSKENGLMDRKAFTNFISKVTGNPNVKENDERVKNAFKKYDKVENGTLDEETFYQMYYESIYNEGNINEAWNNLHNMGYDDYLNKNDENTEYTHLPYEKVVRCMLVIEDEDFIKDLVESINTYPEVNYDTLFFFPTDPGLYADVITDFNLELYDEIFNNDNNVMQLYYFIIIESILQDIELNYIDPTKIFKQNNDSIQKFSSRKYDNFDDVDISKKFMFLENFIENKFYEKLIKYNINIMNKYIKSKTEVKRKCTIKCLKIIKIIYEACLDNKPNDIDLIDDNIYYLDYSHICNEIRDKDELKKIVLDLSYADLFKTLSNYLLNYDKKNDNKDEEELYNSVFDFIITLLTFNQKISSEFFADEKNNNTLMDLIKNSLLSNNSFIINSLTDVLKKKSDNSDNTFITLLSDLIKSLVFSTSNVEKKLFLSKEFFDFFKEINEVMNNTNKSSNDNLLQNILKMLINDINERDPTKKLLNEIFMKYIGLIMKLIEKNPKMKDQLFAYKVSNESLTIAIINKILFNNFDDITDENQLINTNSNNREEEFILIEDKNSENNEGLDSKLKNDCTDFILQLLKEKNNRNVNKEIIDINGLIKENTDKILDNINRQKSQTNYTEASQRSSKVCGYVGLQNLGATCYLNSILQQLYMVPSFRYAIMGADDKESPNSTPKYGPQDDNIFHQLQVMFSHLTLSEQQYYNPHTFCSSYKDRSGNPINIRVQQDTQEFYNDFCDKLELCLKKTKYKYIIDDIFIGKTCSSVVCQSCSHTSNRLENFYCLSLEINNINNLKDSLERLIISESIEDFKCDCCNDKVKIEKRTTLCKLPNTLVIHLKRFYMNYENGNTEKTNSRFEFPPTIDLKNYCVEKFQQAEESELDIYNKNDSYYQYILKGVITHIGNANGGHYYSLIDVDRDGKGNTMRTLKKNEKHNWLKFNDSSVSQFEYNDIGKECYGGSSRDKKDKNKSTQNTQNAYLLIYERVKKTPIKVIVDKNTITDDEKKNIVEFSNDEMKMINKKYDTSKQNSIVTEEELYRKIFYNKEINEYYKYIPYYNVPKYAPKELYNQIMQENKIFSTGASNSDYNKTIINCKEKFQECFYEMIPSLSEEEILSYQITEQNNLINLIVSDVFEKAQKKNLTEQEKVDINKRLNILLVNIIKPLVSKNSNDGVLDNIQRALISKERIEISFLNDRPIFNEENVKQMHNAIKNIINIFKDKDIFTLNNRIFEIIVNYLISRLGSNYRGSDKSNTIQYIYDLLKDLIKIDLIASFCSKKNLFSLLLRNIENEYESNQIVILEIIKTLIKQTKDYDKPLFYMVKSETKKDNAEEIKDKNELRNIITLPIIETIFEKDNDLLLILLKILEYNDKSFTDRCNLEYLPSLMKSSKKKDKLIKFIELCMNIIDIKDDLCLERMKQILGSPVLIVKPKIFSANTDDKIDQQKWPLFGAQLILNNNNDLNTEIYKYTCFYRKQKFCILSYLLPCRSEIETDIKKNEEISEDSINSLIFSLVIKALTKSKNYCLFKYLYLLPARTLNFKNAYEELISILDVKKTYNLSDTKETERIFIEKIEYDLKEVFGKKNNKNDKILEPSFSEETLEYNKKSDLVDKFTGFIPDYLPGEIVKSEIQSIVKTDRLELMRIDYYTKYYNLDEFKKKVIAQNIANVNNKDVGKKIDIEEKLDEKQNIITVDISNGDYQRDENRLINKISKKLENAKKIIINDALLDNNETFNSFIRYIFINKKPFNNEIEARIGFPKGRKENICISEKIYDYVGRHNYVDVLDINKIRKDGGFLKSKDDILISIDSRAYVNDK